MDPTASGSRYSCLARVKDHSIPLPMASGEVTLNLTIHISSCSSKGGERKRENAGRQRKKASLLSCGERLIDVNGQASAFVSVS